LTTGEDSRFPLTRLAWKKNQMEKSGALLTNRQSIDVVRNRLGELLARVDGRDMSERVEELHDLWVKYKQAEAKDDPKMLDYRMEMDDAFEKVYHDYRAWDQIMDVIDLDRKLVESEVKIAKDLHAILTAEDAYDLVAQVFASIIKHVNDPMKLKAIEYELTRIVGDASIIEVERSSGED